MSLFVVTEKTTGKEVYRYQSDEAIAWNGMGFDSHDHTSVVEINPDDSIEGSAVVLTKRGFIKRFTVEEYAAIKAMAAANSTVDYYWQMFLLADEISTADSDTINGLNLLEQIGLLQAGRAQEILND